MTDEPRHPDRPDRDESKGHPLYRDRPVGRRATDKEREIVVSHTNPALFKLALGAVVCWAIIASVASVTVWLQDRKDTQALDRATVALHQSASAKQLAQAVSDARNKARVDNCNATNKRHAATITTLTRGYARLLGLADSTTPMRLMAVLEGNGGPVHLTGTRTLPQLLAGYQQSVLIIGAAVPFVPHCEGQAQHIKP